MNDEQLKIIGKLKALIKIKTSKEFDQDMVQMFLDALGEFTPEEILFGIKKCAQTKTFGIDPSDIIQHIKPSEEDRTALIESLASEALRNALMIVQGHRNIDFHDEIGLKTWQTFGNPYELQADFDKYFANGFKKQYRLLAKGTEGQGYLQIQEAKEKEERLLKYQQGKLNG